ncbi:DUF6363 domain-containing protein [Vibrio sp. SS-MA-C1-2]|uniref:patatin-like phospholipase family protein n=1 Tax=Vibrio sp. SS-MA-C1-2 TaxID=2908646 RepID=UPI001F38D996|nr:patatin-like phospholipase family protein [Vibrio sp. SS-MA-C1-2]UJF19994.1 DUF6363 domain-containing protein [Vibrio sp. SS-MA-C1-2]
MGQRVVITEKDQKTVELLNTLAKLKEERGAIPKKVALVTQGGGERGIFTAGVLDTFLEQQFDPFELYIGTSAGALNLSAFLSRQQGYGYRFIREVIGDKRFFDLFRFIRHNQAMDLDWAIGLSQQAGEFALDVSTARQVLKGKKAFASATRVDSLHDHYFPLYQSDWQEVLKATSAIPILYPEPVNMRGYSWIDGGVSAGIPAQEAYKQGANIIVVVRTEPANQYDGDLEFIQQLQHQFEQHLPNYLKRLNLSDNLTRWQRFHQELSQKMEQFQGEQKKQNSEPIPIPQTPKFIEQALLNGERWLFGQDKIYRLAVLNNRPAMADFLDMLWVHYVSYRETQQFLLNPPDDLTIIELAPSAELQSRALLSQSMWLDLDYQLGKDVGENFLHILSSVLQPNTVI